MSDRPSKVREASEAVDLLRGLKALETNPFWLRRVEGRFTEAYREHVNALAAVSLSPTERAEHIRAFHLARELGGDGTEDFPGFLATERKRLNQVLTDAQAAGITNADFDE